MIKGLVKVLLGVILISGLLWGGLIIVETVFNDGRPGFRQSHWMSVFNNSPGRTAAATGSWQSGWLPRVFSKYQRPDYSRCSLFYNACFGPLALEEDSPISAEEMQRFLSQCLARKGKRDHELAGTAYTLGVKLMEVAREKEKFREALRQVMEREYEILGSQLTCPGKIKNSSRTQQVSQDSENLVLNKLIEIISAWVPNFSGDQFLPVKQAGEQNIKNERNSSSQYAAEQKYKQEQEAQRRFWAQGVQRRWKDYADKTRPECERYLMRLQALSGMKR